MRTAAAPDRMVGAATDAGGDEVAVVNWPERWLNDLPAIAEQMPRHYYHRLAVEPVGASSDDETERRHFEFITREVVRTEARGMGVIREARFPERRTIALPTDNPIVDAAAGSSPSRISLEFMSWLSEPDLQLLRDDDTSAQWKKPTCWMSLTLPTGGDARGLVVTLGPHTTLEWALRDRLPERGWAVLHLGQTVPHGRPDRPSFEFHSGTSIEDAAVAIAQAFDEQIAEYAYAAHAAVGYVREYLPGFADVPVAVLGLSRGALIAPTVAARLGDADAVALLLGGAHLLNIAHATVFKNHGLLTIRWNDPDGSPRRLSRSEQNQLMDAYLAATKLDPFHTAAHLRHTNVLLVTAALDRVVPASSGSLLYERLGRPERWNYPLGHIATAWLINRDADRVIDWLDRAVDSD